MYFCRRHLFQLTATMLLTSSIIGCGGSNSNSGSSSNQNFGAFSSSDLLLDYSLPFSILDRSMPHVSGISFNYEDDYFLVADTNGSLLALSSSGEILNEIALSSAITGIEFIGDGTFLFSEESLVLSFDINTQEVTELHSFAGRYDNIQSIAYREDTGEVVFVNNGSAPVLVYVSQEGTVRELALEERFNNYTIDGLHLSDAYIYMGSTGYQLENEANRKSLVIQTNFEGTFQQAWELDEKVLSAVAIVNESAPEFVSTNLGGDGSINFYEPEAIPSTPSDQPLNELNAIELGFNQPSGIDYVTENNTFYYITDFGEVRSGNAEGVSELLFEIETQQGSYEGISASLNSEQMELNLIGSDNSSEGAQIEKYNLEGELLESFTLTLIHEEHLFESLDFEPASDRYYTVNSNNGERKYLYIIENGITETIELPSDYDRYAISGIDYSEKKGYLYFITEEFEENDKKSAGLMFIYDVVNSIEVSRNSIINAKAPELGLENPSGIAVNDDESVIYITTDIDNSSLHSFSVTSN